MAKKFTSKIGLQPIYSTKDPDGNPATLGEAGCQIIRDNLEIIEKIFEEKADTGGSDKTLQELVNELLSKLEYIQTGDTITKDGQYLMVSNGSVQVSTKNVVKPLIREDVDRAGYLKDDGTIGDDGTSTLYKYTSNLKQIPSGVVSVIVLSMGGAACSIQFFNASGGFISAHGNNTGSWTTPLSITIPSNATQYRYSYNNGFDNFRLEFLTNISQVITNDNAISLIKVVNGIATKAVLNDLSATGIRIVKPGDVVTEKGQYLMLSNGTAYVGNSDAPLLGSISQNSLLIDGILLNDGSFVVNTFYKRSDLLPIIPGTKKIKLYTMPSPTGRPIGFFTSAGVFIKADGYTDSGLWDELKYVDVPSNATQMICCYNTTYYNCLFEMYGTGVAVTNKDKATLITYDGVNNPVVEVLYDFAPYTPNLHLNNLKADASGFIYNGQPLPLSGVTITASNITDAKQVTYKAYSTAERLQYAVSISPQTDNPIVRIGRELGGAIQINGTTVTIYRLNSNLNGYEVHETLTLPFNLLSGNSYLLSIEKTDALSLTYKVVSADAEFSVTYNKEELDSIARRVAVAWGTPFFGVVNGTVRVDKALIASGYNPITKLSIWGDSFIEGASMLDSGIQNRWCALLSDKIGTEFCPIIGKGGEVIDAAFLARFKVENEWYNSPYVILSLGTNHSTVASVVTYKSYMQQAIDYLKERNLIVVLVTVTPRTGVDYNTVTKAMNDWVKASGELYIDMHKAVANPSNPAQWKTGYVQSDGVHPTIEGHAAMYRQVMIDCSLLLYL